MSVAAVSRHRHPQGDPLLDDWQNLASLDALLASSDFVVVACPLNEETRGLLDARRIANMKKDSVLINVARSSIVEEGAIYEALKQRRIGGALIDVWSTYPDPEKPIGLPSPHFPFHELDNVILTPHCAGWTEELEQRRIRAVTDNIMRHVCGAPLHDVVFTS